MTDSKLVTSFIPFPNIYWWLLASSCRYVIFDYAEHFQKMSYRNRYYLSGSNGLIQLSIPLVEGRNQRTAMGAVQICNKQRWQVQHWRTIYSVYKRSPYFDFYEPSLLPLFEQPYTSLSEFCLATTDWLKAQLKLSFEELFADEYEKHYVAIADLRTGFMPGIEKRTDIAKPSYYQLFEDRTGFLPNMSMLDLLFVQGPYSMEWMKNNRGLILEHWS